MRAFGKRGTTNLDFPDSKITICAEEEMKFILFKSMFQNVTIRCRHQKFVNDECF